MKSAKKGDTVRIHYTGKLDDGTVFDSSQGREPLRFTLGEQRVIPGFEEAVLGLAEGGTTTRTIPPARAYGESKAELVFKVERDQIPESIEPEVGQVLQVRQENGVAFPVRVCEVSEDTVTLDANHPLAGKTLTFDIALVEICSEE